MCGRLNLASCTPKHRQRGSGGSAVLPSAGFSSRFGRYRHLPPNPRRRRPIPGRSWVIFLRGVWLFGCSKQGQPDAQKAAGLCRACWGILEILGWNPFFTLRAGGVTTANGWSYYGEWVELLRYSRVELLREKSGERYYGKRSHQRGSGGPVAIPQRWPCSRLGRYRQLPPSPRAKRGQYLGARGLFF